MLFYVQMKWNYQGRVSQDKLWDLEALEGEHGMAGVRAGFVRLYKVVSQHRIIAIVESDSLDDIDRNSMGWLPMREYLEFEQVWALRDYAGFLEDVKAKFPSADSAHSSMASAGAAASTRGVATAWFGNMASGNFDMTLISDDVVWDNISPVPGLSDVAPWLGSYRGLPAVLKSFAVWGSRSSMIKATLLAEPLIDGERAVCIVHERAKCLANGVEYDLYVSTHLRVQGGKITEWRVFWDPSPLIDAYHKK
jgi:ketosteroid isomerase-like protein